MRRVNRGRLDSYTCSMHYGNRIVDHADPKDVEPIAPPRLADVTSDLYDGTTPTLPVWAVARSREFICVRQRVGSELDWYAWVPRDRVTPR